MQQTVPETAIALRYDPDGDIPPEVTAKGRGAIARQIMAIADEHGIPVREDSDLVAILEKLDLGTSIPIGAYAAVAEMLALLYRANLKFQTDRRGQ